MTDQVRLKKWVFWPPFGILFLSAVLSLIDDKMFGAVVKIGFDWSVANFGWLYALSSFLITMLCLIIYCSPAGNIKFGGKDAVPEFGYWNWFAMSLCAGVGIGIVFWGVAEPIHHISYPLESLGLPAFSPQTDVFAISTTFLHWTITPYSLYVICAIPIGIAVYNYHQPMTVSSSLYLFMGKKPAKWLSSIVDALCLFGIASGLVVSLGYGHHADGQRG